MISTDVARSQTDLAKKLGLTQPTFNGYLNEKRQDNLWPLLPQILELYPQLNRDWLYFGEGEMYGEHGGHPPAQVEEMGRRIAALEQELAEERRLNRQLTTRLLFDDGTEKGSVPNAGDAVVDGQQ